MKRPLRAAFMGLVLASSLAFSAVPAFAESAADTGVHVILNGELVSFPDAKPFIDDNARMQVPVRFVSEQLGWNLKWTERGGSTVVTIAQGNQSIRLTSGSTTAERNGAATSLDSAAEMIDNRLYVPLRFIAESFGLPVRWKESLNLAMLGGNANVTAALASSGKAITCKASAYTAARDENGDWAGLDYLGNKLHVGTVAVDPDVIPLGSTLFITGYSYDGLPKGGMFAVASDVGSAIQGNRIDLFVPDSVRKARTFGFQNVKVYVLDTPQQS